MRFVGFAYPPRARQASALVHSTSGVRGAVPIGVTSGRPALIEFLEVQGTGPTIVPRGRFSGWFDVWTTTLWRWLGEDAIRPRRHHPWTFPRDPAFATKAGRVLDLYQRAFQGGALAAGEYVSSADEKTSIQARRRCHPTLPPSRGRLLRVGHQDERGGALA